VVLAGVKITESVFVPAAGTAPEAGVYVKVPATEAVASSWVADRAVPYPIVAGVAHVITGAALFTVRLTLEVTVA
jgi:hypothetical protein